MSKAKTRVIDSMIEVSIIGVRKRRPLKEILYKMNAERRGEGEETSRSIDEALRRMFGPPVLILSQTDHQIKEAVH